MIPGTPGVRLAGAPDPRQAAEVAALLVRLTVGRAAADWPGEVGLVIAPGDPAWYRGLAAEYHLHRVGQSGRDPGQVMHAALTEAIGRSGAAAVLGCGVPHLPAPVLEDAFEQLARGGSVLGPGDNGGCYLIGLQTPCRMLFRGIDRGGPAVLADTLAHARTAGVDLQLLAPERIIECWDDLFLASRRIEALRRYAQARRLRPSSPTGDPCPGAVPAADGPRRAGARPPQRCGDGVLDSWRALS